MKLGLQLYTLRNAYKTGEELLSVLKKVRELGYEGVEFFSFCGLPAEELKKYLNEIGLCPISCHHGVEALDENCAELVRYDCELGAEYVVCSFSPASTAAELSHLEGILRKTQKEAAKYGLKVLYHNHTHELLPMESGIPLELIKQYCNLEADTYWIFNSKSDPAAYLKQNADRIGLIHIKDGDLEGRPCAIGEGKNDIQSIVDAAYAIGAQWLIVENDEPAPDGFSDSERSLHALRSRYLPK